MSSDSFNEMMQELKSVPGAAQHINSFPVIMGKKILQRRKELNLTQQELIELIKAKNENITQSTLSRAESGDKNIKASTYDKIFQALGGVSDMDFIYQSLQKN